MPPDIPKIEAPVTVLPPTVEAIPVKPTQPPQVGDLYTAPRTSAGEEATKLGQRRVNLIWETMQALIAASVVWTTLAVCGMISYTALLDGATEGQAATANTAFNLLSSLASLVIGFYFGRTNHQRVGGVHTGDTGR